MFVILCIPFKINSGNCYITHHLALKIAIQSNLRNIVFTQLSHAFTSNLQSELSGVEDDLGNHDNMDLSLSFFIGEFLEGEIPGTRPVIPRLLEPVRTSLPD